MEGNVPKMTRLIFILLAIFLGSLKLYSQVRGVSASKIGSYNAHTIPGHTLEFEPQFSTGWSDMLRNGSGKRERRFPGSDSVERFTNIDFRVTYAVSDGFEAGLFMTGDYELISVGLKKRIIKEEVSSLSLLAGFNYAAGNGIISVRRRGLESHSSMPLGLAASFVLSPSATIDANAQVEPPVPGKNAMNKTPHYYLSADIGYYPIRELQLVGGFSFVGGTHDFNGPRGFQLVINPGITVETGRQFLLVLAAPFCVAGKTHYCFRSLQLSLTLSFD